MKTFITIIALIQFLTASGQQFILNPEKSKVEWTGYGEIGDFKQEGAINVKEGSLSLVDGIIISAKVIIDMNTIRHQDKNLSKHLSNKDFFWSKKYPTAQLDITSIENNNAIAELTIKNITHSINFPIQFDRRGETIIIKGNMTIDRTLYGIKYNSSSYFQDLGNYAIKNKFDLSFEVIFD
jgi:hypothetical protein